jgi:predicted transcriptional regulator
MANKEKTALRKRIKALAKKGWTQQRIADELHMSVQRVSYYASDRLDKERKRWSAI